MLLEKVAKSVHALGSAVNQDGRSASFMAPHGGAQESVIQCALAAATSHGLHSNAHVHGSEAHGTGTALGDPIEVGSLGRVFGAETRMSLGCAKSNIGHPELAAGILQVIKTVLVLWSTTLIGNLHLRELNPKIAIEAFPALLPSQIGSGIVHQCVGVSSFGASGTNSHAVFASDLQRAAAQTH